MPGQAKNSKTLKSPAQRAAQRARTYKNKKRRIEAQITVCETALKRLGIPEFRKKKIERHIQKLNDRIRFWRSGTVGVK